MRPDRRQHPAPLHAPTIGLAVKSVKKKAVKLGDKVRRRMANRQQVTEYYPAEEQEEGHDGASRPQDPAGEQTDRSATLSEGQQSQNVDPSAPPKVAIGANALDGYNAVSYQSWLGPEDMQLREEPSRSQQQVPVDFPSGQQLFPLDLVEASAENRITGMRPLSASTRPRRRPKYPSLSPSLTGLHASRRSEHATPDLSPVNKSATRTLTEP